MIGIRLKEERERLGYTQSEVSNILGKGLRTIGGWEKGETSPDAEYLIKLNEIGMDIYYILFGKKLPNEQIIDDEYIYIPVFDVEVSAGFGRSPVEPLCVKKHAFRKRWADYHGFNPKELIIVKAVGDSMVPVIQDGEFLVVNKAKNTAVNGKIFVIRVRSELKVKYIETRINGDLVLRSANTFYADEVLTPAILASEDIEIIGEVVHGARDF